MAAPSATRFRLWVWLIRAIGLFVPRRLRDEWRREWEAELRTREIRLAAWGRLDRRNKRDLLRRTASAFRDALCLQRRRLETEVFQDLRYGVRMLLAHRGFTAVPPAGRRLAPFRRVEKRPLRGRLTVRRRLEFADTPVSRLFGRRVGRYADSVLMADDDRTRYMAVLELSRVTRLKGRGDAALPAGLPSV